MIPMTYDPTRETFRFACESFLSLSLFFGLVDARNATGSVLILGALRTRAVRELLLQK
jgi:hypothetical protein